VTSMISLHTSDLGSAPGVRLHRPSAQIATVVAEVLRALSVSVPVALCGMPAAVAQTVEPAPLAADIPAQPLGQALSAFASQTGLQLVYVSEIVGHRRSHAVAAGLSPQEALSRLLLGTGLRFEYLTPKSIRILAGASPQKGTKKIAADYELGEVIVTANRREEDLQDVSMTMQVLTDEQLKELNSTTFNSLLHYAPNVSFSGNGPGTGNIFIRGLGSVGTGNQSQATAAPFPNTALYLDEQPMQFPSRNNDVYIVDMQRIEVLEGPQGTLFGGGAQAGAIRYITHRPELDRTGAEVTAGYGTTAHGDNNRRLNAILNVPLVSDKVAARAVVFSEHQGGFIDNVPSTIGYVPGTLEATSGAKANNAAQVSANTNSTDYRGVRLSMLWRFSDAWNLLLQQSYQSMEADGYFYVYPHDSNGKALQPYQIAAFAPAYTRDRYESTAWTLDGRLGSLKAIYAGSFMVRHIEGQQDYSNYLRSAAGAAYGCIGAGSVYFNDVSFPKTPPDGLLGTKLTCYAPVGYWHDAVENQHQSHELRISTDPQRRVRALVGTFWEKFVIFDQMDWYYMRIPQCGPPGSPTLAKALAGGPACLSAVGPFPGSFANDPSLRKDVAFGQDYQRGYKQLAFFGSVDFDLIPRVLSVTAGVRHYHYGGFEDGSQYFSETTSPTVLNRPDGICTLQGGPGACGYPVALSNSESGSVTHANLTWHATSAVMAYYSFSQGFRPGAFNRTPSLPGQIFPFSMAQYCGAASLDPRCRPGGSLFNVNTAQYARPAGYRSDKLINNEIGIRSSFLNHRVLLNASAYTMRWNHIQQQLYDPETFGSAIFVANGPDYSIKGMELQLVARVAQALTLHGSTSWNLSHQTNPFCLESTGRTPATPNNPTPAGQCITVVNGAPYTNPWGQAGSSLPYSPRLQFNVRSHYEWHIGAFRPFAMISASYIATMRNTPANYPDGDGPGQNPPTTTLLKYTIPAYTLFDAALGVVKENWTAQIQATNVTNVYGPINITSAQFIKSEVPLRPRALMAQFTHTF
jgi:iron complex outermembrane recepter protein